MGFLKLLFKKVKGNIQENNQDGTVLENGSSCKGYPSSSGLYPTEVMMLFYAPSYKISEITYPDKFRTEYGVGFPKKVFAKLKRKGYIRKSLPVETIDKLTLTELKEIAVENNLEVSGDKGEIVDRISRNLSKNKLKTYALERYWVLTERGEREKRENEYLGVFLEKHSYNLLEVGISLLRLNELHQQNGELNGRDLIWGELNKLSISSYQQAFQNGDFSQYCSVLNIMSYFTEEESKYLAALRLCARYLFYHINFEVGLESIQWLIELDGVLMMDTLSNLFYMDIELLPQMVTRIKELMSKSGVNSTELNQLLLTEFNAISEEGYLSKEQTAEFIMDQLGGKISDAKELCIKATRNVKRKYVTPNVNHS